MNFEMCVTYLILLLCVDFGQALHKQSLYTHHRSLRVTDQPTNDTQIPPNLPPCQDCACGQRSAAARVVGGAQTAAHAHPWLARLLYQNNFGCGASLINDRFVISASHCVKGFMWFMFRVTLGEWDRCAGAAAASRRVVRALAHNFTLQELSNDVAVLMMSAPVEYGPAVRPICLPTADVSYAGASAVVAGWGAAAERGRWSCTPRAATLPVLRQAACRATPLGARVRDAMLCAGDPDAAERDACTGDSGGPLMAENKNQAYELIGIVSWGQGCARKGYPGVYTRVTKYLDWIQENTREGCYCKY